VPQGDTGKNDKFSMQNGCKVHQIGQICNGAVSQNKCHFTWNVSCFFQTTFALCHSTDIDLFYDIQI